MGSPESDSSDIYFLLEERPRRVSLDGYLSSSEDILEKPDLLVAPLREIGVHDFVLHCSISSNDIKQAEEFIDLWTHETACPLSTTDGVRSIKVDGKQYMPRMTYFEPGKPLWVYYDNDRMILLTEKQMDDANISWNDSSGYVSRGDSDGDQAQQKYIEIVVALNKSRAFRMYERDHGLYSSQQRNWDEVKRFYTEYYSSIVLAHNEDILQTFKSELEPMAEEVGAWPMYQCMQLSHIQSWIENIIDQRSSTNYTVVMQALEKYYEYVWNDKSSWYSEFKTTRLVLERLFRKTTDKYLAIAAFHGIMDNIMLDGGYIGTPIWETIKRACYLEEPTDPREAVKVIYDAVDELYREYGPQSSDDNGVVDRFVGRVSHSTDYTEDFKLLTRCINNGMSSSDKRRARDEDLYAKGNLLDKESIAYIGAVRFLCRKKRDQESTGATSASAESVTRPDTNTNLALNQTASLEGARQGEYHVTDSCTHHLCCDLELFESPENLLTDQILNVSYGTDMVILRQRGSVVLAEALGKQVRLDDVWYFPTLKENKLSEDLIKNHPMLSIDSDFFNYSIRLRRSRQEVHDKAPVVAFPGREDKKWKQRYVNFNIATVRPPTEDDTD